MQRGYYWLLDHTGVYLATIMFGLNVANAACVVTARGHTSWIDFVFLGGMGLIGCVYYRWQSSNNETVYNVNAVKFRRSLVRKLSLVFVAALVFARIAAGEWWYVAGLVTWLAWLFVACLQIRRREPPEHWVEARQGAR